MAEFSLGGRPYVALHNLLKFEGLCESGAAAKHAIEAGKVSVDGRVELRKRCKITAGRVIEFQGRSIQVTE